MTWIRIRKKHRFKVAGEIPQRTYMRIEFVKKIKKCFDVHEKKIMDNFTKKEFINERINVRKELKFIREYIMTIIAKSEDLK